MKILELSKDPRNLIYLGNLRDQEIGMVADRNDSKRLGDFDD